MAEYEFDIQGNRFQVEAATQEEALSKALAALGQQGAQEQPAQPPAAPSLRERFAQGMGAAAQPLEKLVEGITYAGAPSMREPVAPGRPTGARLTGQAVGSVVPRTPEGVALSAIPGLGALGTIPKVAQALPRFGAASRAMMQGGPGSVTRDLLTYPALGAGTAFATGGSGGEVAAGAGLGLLQGGATAGMRGLQRLGRRVTGKEISERAVERHATEQIEDAGRAVAGLEADLGLKLTGRNAGEKLVRAPQVIREMIGKDYGLMQTSLEKGLKGRSLTLPRLAAIRGETTTIPGTPGVPPSGLLGPTGQPVSQGTPGTPSTQSLNTSFTPKEAMEAIKDFGGYVRAKSYTAAGAPKGGQPMTGRELRLENQAVRAELVQELTRQGRPDLGAKFQEASGFYRKGLDAQDLLESVTKAKGLRGGSTEEGGIQGQAWRDVLAEQGYADDFPWLSNALQRGTSLGARELLRPGMEAGVSRLYGPAMGVSPRLPATTVPVGTGPLGPRLGPLTGAGTRMGVEALLRDREKAPSPLTSAAPLVE